MQKLALFILTIFVFGCGPTNDVTAKSISSVSEAPLTEITVTEDCKDGGTYQLTARVDTTENPAMLDLDVAYVYTACVEKGRTYGGTVSYSKLQQEIAADSYSTQIIYASALTYDGGSCDATYQLTDTAEKPTDKVSIAGSCPHPGAKDMSHWEKKCKLKKPKGKGKKGKCDLRL